MDGSKDLTDLIPLVYRSNGDRLSQSDLPRSIRTIKGKDKHH